MRTTSNLYQFVIGIGYIIASIYMFIPLTGPVSYGQLSLALIIFVVVARITYRYKINFEFDIESLIWSIVFSFFQALNKAFAMNYSLTPYKDNFGTFFIQVIIGMVFSYPIFYLCKMYITNNDSPKVINIESGSDKMKIKYWQILLIFIVVWITFIVFSLPISISNDAMDELLQFASYNQMIDLHIPLNNHHPVFDTMILGILFKMGLFIHNSFAFGVLFIALVQTISTAIGFSFIIYQLAKSDVSIFLKWFFFIMMLLSPMWINLNGTIVKDNLLLLPLVFWFYIYSLLIIDKAKVTETAMILFFLLSVIVSLMRPNTFYVVAISLVSLFFLDSNKLFRLKLLILTFTTVLAVLGYNSVINSTGIIPAKSVEMMSVPLQQTARTIKNHDVSLNKKERKIVDNIIAPQSIKYYNPQVSDPIKGSYNWDGKNLEFNKKLKEFLPIWLKLGIRYPKTYFEATYANIFGYINVTHRDSGQGQVLFTNYDAVLKISDAFKLKNEYMTQEQVNQKNNIAHNFTKILNAPIVNIYQNIGLWSWFLIYIFTTSLVRFKSYKRNVLLVLPSVLTLGTLFLSPVNGLNRYYIPIFIMIPIIIVSFKIINIKLEKD